MTSLLRPPRLGVRLGLDGVMVLLFATSLAFRATDREAHEWIGLSFCALVLLHTLWNLGWYKTLFSGKHHARRAVNTLTNLALLAATAVMCGCGIANSRHIFGFSRCIDGESARRLHCFAAYWGLVFLGIHAGLHWEMVMAAVKKHLPTAGGRANRVWGVWAARLFAGAIAVLGVWASFERDMGSKLFLGFSFDFWSPDRPLPLFYACNLAIMGLYGAVAHYARKCLGRAP